MGVFSLQHARSAYQADFVFFGLAMGVLAGVLVLAGPHDQWPSRVIDVAAGLVGWTAIEYGLHRYVLHGVQPFKGWHAQHHAKPLALIGTPTVLSAALILILVFLPALMLAGPWRACGLTLGVVAGYFAYSLTHHGVHHWHVDSAWLKQRKRWHALHHHKAQPACFGVTSDLWDRVFGTAL
jgi:sterol desaturase/sphingolipid hydroxylase (fatty acid hydroxylase superfamily)